MAFTGVEGDLVICFDGAVLEAATVTSEFVYAFRAFH